MFFFCSASFRTSDFSLPFTRTLCADASPLSLISTQTLLAAEACRVQKQGHRFRNNPAISIMNQMISVRHQHKHALLRVVVLLFSVTLLVLVVGLFSSMFVLVVWLLFSVTLLVLVLVLFSVTLLVLQGSLWIMWHEYVLEKLLSCSLTHLMILSNSSKYLMQNPVKMSPK